MIDINECANQNGGCEQNCQNNIGSYSCSCLTGYLTDKNGHNCTGLYRQRILYFKLIFLFMICRYQ